jgi:hypothetical protein
VASFLNDRGVNSLRFVCLTHPHDDHFSGVMQLLENFEVQQFWHFSVISVARLRQLIKAKLKDGLKDEKSTGRKTNARELAKLWKEVNARSRKGAIVVQRLSLGHSCIPPEEGLEFTVQSIGPSPRQSQRFEERLKHAFDAKGNFLPTASHRDPNLCSCGLLIEYGKTRILLGGDIEEGGWTDLISQRQFLVEGMSLVKIAHHGSPNGYVEGLWQLHNNRAETTYKILTPYKRFDLPKKSTIDHVSNHGAEIYSAGHPYFDHDFVPSYVVSLAKLQSGEPAESGTTSRVSMTFDDAGQLNGAPIFAGDAIQIC